MDNKYEYVDNSVRCELYRKIEKALDDVEKGKTRSFFEFVVDFERKHCN